MLPGLWLSGFQNSRPPGEIASFEVSGKNFVIRGSDLARVEIQFFSSGTGITSPGTLGMARRITSAGKSEVWVLPLPAKEDLLIVEIFAVGFDKRGEVVGKKSWPYSGVTSINEGLFSSGTWYQIRTQDSGKHFTYPRGESFDLLLWPTSKYPLAEVSVTCSPAGALKIIPNVPNIFPTVTAVRYEAVRKGGCKITDRNFRASVTVQ